MKPLFTFSDTIESVLLFKKDFSIIFFINLCSQFSKIRYSFIWKQTELGMFKILPKIRNYFFIIVEILIILKNVL